MSGGPGPSVPGPGHPDGHSDPSRPALDIEVGRRVAAALGLEPLPLEGGLFRRTFTADSTTAILFMLVDRDFSAMHRLSKDEIYFHHAGSPLRMLLIDPAGNGREVIIGPDVLAGQQPQFAVPANWWQGSSTDGGWSLVSTVVSPGFDWADFTLADRADLTGLCPAAADRIAELTRTEPATDPSPPSGS